MRSISISGHSTIEWPRDSSRATSGPAWSRGRVSITLISGSRLRAPDPRPGRGVPSRFDTFFDARLFDARLFDAPLFDARLFDALLFEARLFDAPLGGDARDPLPERYPERT